MQNGIRNKKHSTQNDVTDYKITKPANNMDIYHFLDQNKVDTRLTSPELFTRNKLSSMPRKSYHI